MPTNEALEALLAQAIQAPSGDNAQPWEFELNEGTIEVFNLPARDETLYNFRQQGSYLAHGALVENISLLAARDGYHTEVELFPGGTDCTARISFSPAESLDSELARAIPSRTTNRKPYDGRPLAPQHRLSLLQAVKPVPEASVSIMEGEQAITALAGALCVNERLLMENRPLHDFLFSMIRWDVEDAQPGLYVKTMEFPSPIRFVLQHILRYWPAVRLLNLVGLSRAIAKQTAGLYRTSSAIGIISIEDVSPASFFLAGRAFERLWLAAAAAGLSLQPVTALPYLVRRLEGGEGEAFTLKQVEIIRAAHGAVCATAGLPADRQIAMIFRIGYGGEPSARSHKLPPCIRPCTRP